MIIQSLAIEVDYGGIRLQGSQAYGRNGRGSSSKPLDGQQKDARHLLILELDSRFAIVSILIFGFHHKESHKGWAVMLLAKLNARAMNRRS